MIIDLAAYKQSVFENLKRKLRDKITRLNRNGGIDHNRQEEESGIEEESK